VLIVGQQDLIGLTGQVIPSGNAARLVIASWATALAPMLGFTSLAILLSVRTRNPAFGIAAPVVVGMIMQLLGSLGGVEAATSPETEPMPTCFLRRTAALLAAGVTLFALSGCGSSDVTKARLERDLPQTFSNLYVQQAKLLGHAHITVHSLHAQA
jgi:hypothetical protein